IAQLVQKEVASYFVGYRWIGSKRRMTGMNGEMQSRNMDVWQFLTPWMSTTGLTLLLLVIAAAFLAFYCHTEHVPYPMRGVGHAAFVVAMVMSFVPGLLMFRQLRSTPAQLMYLQLPSAGGKKAPTRAVIPRSVYLGWFAVPQLV